MLTKHLSLYYSPVMKGRPEIPFILLAVQLVCLQLELLYQQVPFSRQFRWLINFLAIQSDKQSICNQAIYQSILATHQSPIQKRYVFFSYPIHTSANDGPARHANRDRQTKSDRNRAIIKPLPPSKKPSNWIQTILCKKKKKKNVMACICFVFYVRPSFKN